jgi:hypothetical protein
MSDHEEPAIPVIQARASAVRHRASPKRRKAKRAAPKRQPAQPQPVAAEPTQARPAQAARENAPPPEHVRRVSREERDAGWADLPARSRRPGWDFEWKTIRILNDNVDSGDLLEVRNAGWRPEKASDWPDLTEPGTPPEASIERRGQRLYGRPMRLTVEARQEDLEHANKQLRDKTLAAAQGGGSGRSDGIPVQRGVRSVPIEVSIVGEAG